MKKFNFTLLFLLLSISICNAQQDSLNINVINGTYLKEYIDESVMGKIRYLKVSGYLNAHDLDVIYSKMCGFAENRSKNGYHPVGDLKILDLSEARLVDPSSPISNNYIGWDRIPEGAFCIRHSNVGTTLEELYLPVCDVDRESFQYSENLRKVVIPQGTTIGGYCFDGCNSLDTIYYPKSVYSTYAFRGTSLKAYIVEESNPNLCSINGALASKNKNTLYTVPWGLDFFRVPESIKNLSECSFQSHPKIRTICLGSNVTEIASDCFWGIGCLSNIIITSTNVPIIKKSNVYEPFFGCKNITSSGKLYVPQGTKDLYLSAPGWCKIPNIIEYNVEELKYIIETIANEEEHGDFDFKIDNIYYKVISVPDLTVGVCNGAKEYEGIINIPPSVSYKNRTFKVISVEQMSGRNLISVNIPESVTHIGSMAGSGVKYLDIPDNVTDISTSAFYGCDRLESIRISSKVKELPRSLFTNCYSLKCVKWDPSYAYASISGHTFQECNALKSLKIPSNVTSTGYHYSGSLNYQCAIFSCASLDTLIIEDGDRDLYFGWEYNDYLDHYNPSKGEFYLCNIKNLYLGRNYSFSERGPNLAVEHLTIGDNITSVKYWPVSQNLKTLKIGKLVQSVPSFSNLKAIESITVRSNIPPRAVEFSNETYMNTILYVPNGTKDKYESASVWKNFWNIVETDIVDSIENIDINDSEKQIYYYNIDGIRNSTPKKGVNIIVFSDGSIKKIFVK